ncbi:MAG: hypothetical protein GQ468_05305 [Candidatus Scalindua sp.]|nr:hypothetical protein [Candidatus Scalindua sp.]
MINVKITEDDVENACGDLECAIMTLHMNMNVKDKEMNVQHYSRITEEIQEIQKLVMKIMMDDAADSINKYV